MTELIEKITLWEIPNWLNRRKFEFCETRVRVNVE